MLEVAGDALDHRIGGDKSDDLHSGGVSGRAEGAHFIALGDHFGKTSSWNPQALLPDNNEPCASSSDLCT
jgi:hypothetical protein